MTGFIPEGFCDFSEALNAVGKYLFPDDWLEPEVLPVDDLLYNPSAIDALRRMAAPPDPKLSEALTWLRQQLYNGDLLAKVQTATSGKIPIPKTEWGSDDKWNKVVSSGRIEFASGETPMG